MIFVHPFGCHLALFHTYWAVDLPGFEVLQISLNMTFLFVTQLPCDLFRYWFGRVNLISQNFDAQLNLIHCLRKDLIFLPSLYDICLTVWPSIYQTLDFFFSTVITHMDYSWCSLCEKIFGTLHSLAINNLRKPKKLMKQSSPRELEVISLEPNWGHYAFLGLRLLCSSRHGHRTFVDKGPLSSISCFQITVTDFCSPKYNISDYEYRSNSRSCEHYWTSIWRPVLDNP